MTGWYTCTFYAKCTPFQYLYIWMYDYMHAVLGRITCTWIQLLYNTVFNCPLHQFIFYKHNFIHYWMEIFFDIVDLNMWLWGILGAFCKLLCLWLYMLLSVEVGVNLSYGTVSATTCTISLIKQHMMYIVLHTTSPFQMSLFITSMAVFTMSMFIAYLCTRTPCPLNRTYVQVSVDIMIFPF